MARKRRQDGEAQETWPQLAKRASLRQRRLFACAACRWWWDQLGPNGRHLVEVAERLADRRATTPEDLRQAREGGWKEEVPEASPEGYALNLVSYDDAAIASAWEMSIVGWRSEPRSERETVRRRTALLREIVGPAAPPAFEPDWLSWQDGQVARLARVIYDERAFGQLPVLADALEEAGCADERILAHCRADAEHVRGCWVLDGALAQTARY
jgi:hypothetical protein